MFDFYPTDHQWRHLSSTGQHSTSVFRHRATVISFLLLIAYFWTGRALSDKEIDLLLGKINLFEILFVLRKYSSAGF
jgi:hypothetical protein